MELAVREAKARLSELIAAAEKGERVVITKHGVPAVELVRCRPRGGIDFDKLEEARRRLGIEGDGERWPDEFNDPSFSRRVLGLEPEDGYALVRVLLDTSYLRSTSSCWCRPRKRA
jgi:prevent-host-death family protein